MPRYMVERIFPDGLHIPISAEGEQACSLVNGRNNDLGVTWVHSYVSEDKTKTYCIYEGPNEDAIRKAASANNIPVDSITEVPVTLEPK